MRKSKIAFREIANRITGFEIPVFGGGLSWNPPTSEIEVATRLLTYLEDRRALYQPYDMETAAHHVVQSILEIRKRLTADLEQVERSSPLAQSIAAMRTACREFLDNVGGIDTDFPSRRIRGHPDWFGDDRNFFIALGKLRGIIGLHIAQISIRYGIDVEESLATIFPGLPKE